MVSTALLESARAPAWHLLGVVGALLFYGRFYVQWIASEREGRSTIPTAFWYLSSAGSLALLVYAVVTRSPLGALGQCFNIVVYTRNIVFILRKRSRLRPWVSHLLQFGAGTITLLALVFVVVIWLHEYTVNQEAPPEVAQRAWFWLGLGLLGQALFAGRFLVQWIASERRGESTVPPIFWHLSLVAGLLQALSFLQRGEWLFMSGMLLTVLIYARNIALSEEPVTKESAA